MPESLNMRYVDVLSNIKNFSCWSFKKYPLDQKEADPVIKSLDIAIKLKEKYPDIYNELVENK